MIKWEFRTRERPDGPEGHTMTVEFLDVHFDNPSERAQLEVLMEAAAIYAERNVEYKDNWKRMGWRGQLIRARERAERLWDSLWDEKSFTEFPRSDSVGASNQSIVLRKKLDDAFDLINFAAFLVRGVRDGNRDGEWWS